MPRLDHRVNLHNRLSAQERLLVQLMLRLVNPLRVQLSLAPVTEGQILQIIRQLLHEQDEE